MNEWNIQSRAHACQACLETFADKAVYHTLLFEQRDELLRQDICADCWKSQHSEGAGDRKGFVSHWQGVYEAPPAAPPDPIQKENAESLLRKLTELNDPKYAPAAYILAAMLERKRLLKVKEQIHRDGQRIFVYEQAKTGDIFTIPDPKLQLNQLETVQHDVAHLLEHGLPQPEPAPATPAEPPATDNPPAPEPAAAANEAAAEAPAPVAIESDGKPPTAN